MQQTKMTLWLQLGFSFGIKILLFTGVSPGLTVHDQEQTPALCIKKNLIFF